MKRSSSSHISLDVLKPDFGIPFIIYVTFFLGPGRACIRCLYRARQEGLSRAPTGSLLFVTIAIYLITAHYAQKISLSIRNTVFAYFCSGAVLVQSFLFLALSLFRTRRDQRISQHLFLRGPECHNYRFCIHFSFFLHRTAEHRLSGEIIK